MSYTAFPIGVPECRRFANLIILSPLLLTGIPGLRSEELSAAPAPVSQPVVSQESAPVEITHLGQTFALTNHREDPTVETDEYLPKGETIGDWSQLLTVQRLRLPHATTTAELVTHLSKRIGVDPRGRLLVIRQGRQATVFSAQLPASEGIREQRLIGIIFLNTAELGAMSVIQFALAPAKVDAGLAELIMDSWKQKYLRQADALNGTARVGD